MNTYILIRNTNTRGAHDASITATTDYTWLKALTNLIAIQKAEVIRDAQHPPHEQIEGSTTFILLKAHETAPVWTFTKGIKK